MFAFVRPAFAVTFPFAVGIAVIATLVGAASADTLPKLNVSPSCDAAARGAIVIGRDKEACLGDEHTAQDTLQKNWNTYNAADKVQCLGNVRTGGPASYVELLSCLEIMRDAKSIRETDGLDADPTPAPHPSGHSRKRSRTRAL